MTCADMLGLRLDAQRGRLAPNLRAEMDAHVQTCAACLHEEAAEQLLTETLESRLPQHAAPLALKRRLWVSDMDMPEVTRLAEKLAPTAGTATYSTSQ